jgi:hypothetical protein
MVGARYIVHRAEAGAEKGTQEEEPRLSRRCEDARRASRDRGHESVMQSWRSSVFSARVTRPHQATAQNERRPQRSKTDRTGVSRMCVTRCRRGLPIKNLKGLRHTQTTWGRPGANEAPGATDRYVRANCTYHLSHLSTAALYTGGSAADASLHNTYPRGFTRPRAHGPCPCRLMGCEPHLPPRKDPGRHTLQTHSDRGGCGTPMQGRLKCRGIL